MRQWSTDLVLMSPFFCAPLPAQVNGLVHISQLADEFVANCEDHVKEGDTVRQVNQTNAQATPTHKRCQPRARELLIIVGCRTRIECDAGVPGTYLSTNY